MHDAASAESDSLGASPSSALVPSSTYGVKGSLDSAARTESGGGGVPTLGAVTLVSGPLVPVAVHAVRAAQQIRIPRPMRIRVMVPSLPSCVPKGRERAG